MPTKQDLVNSSYFFSKFLMSTPILFYMEVPLGMYNLYYWYVQENLFSHSVQHYPPLFSKGDKAWC